MRNKKVVRRAQLVIDSAIMELARKNKRNIYSALIDYKKAYDMIPHSWLIEVLRIYKINTQLINFLKSVMSNWKTSLVMSSGDRQIRTNRIQIKRGIFQGDTFNPLWFCLGLNPLSTLLKETTQGFEIKDSSSGSRYRINHLFYMDDLKNYAATKQQLLSILSIVETYSSDISMEFGIDKCRTQRVIKGKGVTGSNYETMDHEIIRPMEENEHYKYLGILQSTHIEHTAIKETLKSEFVKRLKNVLRTGLNAKNLVSAINTYAIPILTYSFGIIKWSNTDLEALERIIRTNLTRYKYHHPKSAVQRVTLPRRDGGRGLINIKNLHVKQILSIRNYFYEKEPVSQLHKAVVEVDKDLTPLRLNNKDRIIDNVSNEQLIREWKGKSLHGRYPQEISSQYVDREASYKWLTLGVLYPETEGFLIAIQDQVIATKNYRKYIMNDSQLQNDLCRKCNAEHETIQHILGGCGVITQSEYKDRHDMVGKILHRSIGLKYGLLEPAVDPYYRYKPQSVLEDEQIKLYWDRTIHTDRSVQHNRPDITVVDKRRKKVSIIDIAVVNTNNLESTYSTKLNKYQHLMEEIRSQWGVNNITITPIVISTTGIIPKNIKNNLRHLGLRENIYIEMQKSVILSSCSIVRRFLSLQH